MTKLDRRRINFVKGLSLDVKAKVLFEFLKKGTSNRHIEKIVNELREEDGWQAWSVIHFYGFDKESKGRYSRLSLTALKEELSRLNDEELEELYLDSEGTSSDIPIVSMGKNDGRDVFRQVKTRQGQTKLRKIILHNYQSKCALCNISHPRLLITSHIKTWADSFASTGERVDPCNAILLCNLHDSLFEHGFISLDDNYHVLFSNNFDFDSQGISRRIEFRKPIQDLPSPDFLREHRIKHGYE